MFTINSFRSFLEKFMILFIYSIFFSCKTIQNTEPQAKKGQMGDLLSKPNSCYITGEIIRIDKFPASNDSLSVCSKAPCFALVRINSVSACGSSISRSIHATDTLQVYFVFSLAPTATLNTLIKPPLPGLEQGNIFEAYLEQRIALGDHVNYRIYGYSLK